MTIYKYECRACKKVTDQIERIITDNLPQFLVFNQQFFDLAFEFFDASHR